MGKSQRTKGASYEREVCHALAPLFGELKRNIGQARDGGDDITTRYFSIECKRRKTLGTVYGWLRQCVTSARSKQKMPVVIAREDQGEHIVIMRLEDWMAVIEDAGLHQESTPPAPADA